MDASAAPACPACGFHVYNRRFPRCESCNADLSEELVYNDVERHALLAADAERDLERDRNAHLLSTPLATSLDDSLLQGVVDLTAP